MAANIFGEIVGGVSQGRPFDWMTNLRRKYRWLLYKAKVDRFGGYYLLALVFVLAVLYLLFGRSIRPAKLIRQWMYGDGTVANEMLDETSNTDSASDEPNAEIVEKIDEADLSILFIGNQRTDIGNVPDLLRSMLEQRYPDKKIFVHQHTYDRMKLVAHARTAKTRALLGAGDWDFVVLQGDRDATTTQGVDAFSEMQESKGKRIVLYALWGVKGHIEQASRIHRNNLLMAKPVKFDVAPVAMAWLNAHKESNNRYSLYSPGANNSSTIGNFLSGCVFFSFFTNQSATELGEIDFANWKEGTRIPPVLRKRIAKIAWDTVEKEAYFAAGRDAHKESILQ